MARRRPRGFPGTTTRGRSSPIRRTTREQLPDPLVEDRTTAQRQHPAGGLGSLPAERAGHRGPFELAKGFLAVLDENVTDRLFFGGRRARATVRGPRGARG